MIKYIHTTIEKMKKEIVKNIASPEPIMSCIICCEDYNQSQRKEIKCGYCDFDACRKCCETYLLSEAAPRCMKPECGKEWSRQFLVANFTPAFVNKRYKEHRENILLQREKSLMPTTQEKIEREKREAEMVCEIRMLRLWIQNLRQEKRVMYALGKLEKYSEPNSFLQLNPSIDKTMLYRFQNIDIQITKLDELVSNLERQLNRRGVQERRQFIHACPNNECRGFLSNRWKCGICDKYTCPDCHELKEEEHVCDPNVVENVKLLQKDTKPCPKCASQIYRIDGCDHMWCTSCHTGFHWITGRIENRPENPHYYEWLRRGGGNIPRQPGDDNPCGGGDGDYILIPKVLYAKADVPLIAQHRMNRILTHHQDIYHTKMRTFDPPDEIEMNEKHRRNYLRNVIDENEFKRIIQINEKKTRKNSEIRNVLELSCSMIRDIALRAKDNLSMTPNHFSRYLTEMDNAMEYCNELFRNISQTYGCVLYEFTPEFYLYSTSTLEYQSYRQKEEEKKKAIIDLSAA